MSPLERRINCTATEIRAYQAGERTLRRKVKNPHYYGCPTGDCPHWDEKDCNAAMNEPSVLEDSPFGSPGDTLVLREAFNYIDAWCEKEARLLDHEERIRYKADGDESPDGFAPASKMPRELARYTPTVRTVRVEQIGGVWWWVCEVS